jgi:hypothetical protein
VALLAHTTPQHSEPPPGTGYIQRHGGLLYFEQHRSREENSIGDM